MDLGNRRFGHLNLEKVIPVFLSYTTYIENMQYRQIFFIYILIYLINYLISIQIMHRSTESWQYRFSSFPVENLVQNARGKKNASQASQSTLNWNGSSLEIWGSHSPVLWFLLDATCYRPQRPVSDLSCWCSDTLGNNTAGSFSLIFLSWGVRWPLPGPANARIRARSKLRIMERKVYNPWKSKTIKEIVPWNCWLWIPIEIIVFSKRLYI